MPIPAGFRLSSLLLTAALASCATPQASLGSFEAVLARQDSATAALGEWCAAQGIADPPKISAHPVPGNPVPEASDTRALLAVSPGEPLEYRHVRLTCGDSVLSEAHNWYVRSRLTPEMNATLEETETPFGRAVAALNFTRTRLATGRGAAAECPADTILSTARF